MATSTAVVMVPKSSASSSSLRRLAGLMRMLSCDFAVMGWPFVGRFAVPPRLVLACEGYEAGLVDRVGHWLFGLDL